MQNNGQKHHSLVILLHSRRRNFLIWNKVNGILGLAVVMISLLEEPRDRLLTECIVPGFLITDQQLLTQVLYSSTDSTVSYPSLPGMTLSCVLLLSLLACMSVECHTVGQQSTDSSKVGSSLNGAEMSTFISDLGHFYSLCCLHGGMLQACLCHSGLLCFLLLSLLLPYDLAHLDHGRKHCYEYTTFPTHLGFGPVTNEWHQDNVTTQFCHLLLVLF